MQSRVEFFRHKFSVALCSQFKLFSSEVKSTGHSTESDLHAGDKFHYGTEIEKVEVYPRYYTFLGDAESTAKKFPLEKIEPTPRTIFTWEGRQYPYPYRSLMEEENGPAVIKWLHEQGHVNSSGLLKLGGLKRHEMNKIMQYWFQANDDKETHMMIWYDPYIFYFIVFFTSLMFISALYWTYTFLTPKEKNIFLYENWKRWNSQH